MKAILLIVVIIVMVGAFLWAAYRRFYSQFREQAGMIRSQAGVHDSELVTDVDLEGLPEPMVRYLRFSGVVGRKRISALRLVHSGAFRTSAKRPFMPIKGEYFLTTKMPSFCWYGKITWAPGLSVSAFDSYFNGRGRMIVKVMSVFNVVDAHSKEMDPSAFSRCVAEMTLVPSFFLDKEKVRWTHYNSSIVECVVSDAGLSTQAEFYVNHDGSLDKIVVERFFARGKGKATLEKFTGRGSDYRDYNGLKLPAIIDGYWNLKEGDLHYVHFIVESVKIEE